MSDKQMNGVPLPDEIYHRIESLLGRPIRIAEQGNIDTFANFSDSDLKELEGVAKSWGGTLPCIAYVRFRLAGRTPLSTAASFVDHVVRQGNSMESWLRITY